MPLYEYQCTKCNKRTEKSSVAGPHLKKCPHCGGRVERLQSLRRFSSGLRLVRHGLCPRNPAAMAPVEKTDSGNVGDCLQGNPASRILPRKIPARRIKEKANQGKTDRAGAARNLYSM